MKDIPIEEMTIERLRVELHSALNANKLLLEMQKQTCKWTSSNGEFFRTSCGTYTNKKQVLESGKCQRCFRTIEIVEIVK